MKRSVFIGWDPREAAAFAVARQSIQRRLTGCLPIRGLVLADLIEKGLYRRPIERRPHLGHTVMWDVISDAPMSTEHANARFLVKELAGTGWALFMDGDMLVRDNLLRLFDGLNGQFAAYCVKHKYVADPGVKMDGQIQTQYSRKNWSSFLVINCDHPSNKALTVDFINTAKGLDLHGLTWLKDEEIGELGPEWNFLVGPSQLDMSDPRVVHFTTGVPDMPGYENQSFADEWFAERRRWIG